MSSLQFFEFLKKDFRKGYGGFIEINPQFMVHRPLKFVAYVKTQKILSDFGSLFFVLPKNKFPEIGSVSSFSRRGEEVSSRFLRIRRANVHIWILDCDSSYYVGSNHTTSCLPTLPPEDRNAFIFL